MIIAKVVTEEVFISVNYKLLIPLQSTEEKLSNSIKFYLLLILVSGNMEMPLSSLLFFFWGGVCY